MKISKNQHYLPQFYLRQFSNQLTRKQIGLYNLKGLYFIPNAPIKTQCSEDYYYGKDGELESLLAQIETVLAPVIQKIVNTLLPPKYNSIEHWQLLLFIVLTIQRNPQKHIPQLGVQDKINTILKNENTPLGSELYTNSSKIDIIQNSFKFIELYRMMCGDLKYKLVVNKSDFPFITSDFPVVMYNQYIEKLKKQKIVYSGTKTGYATKGLQLILPLTSTVSIIFYDSEIYKVGDNKKNLITFHDSKDVEQLNVLQYLNCIDTVYFDEAADESYIKFLHNKSKIFRPAHIENVTQSQLMFPDNGQIIQHSSHEDNLIVINNSECETNLNINGISIHSKGKRTMLDSTVAQWRNSAKETLQQFLF